MKAREESANSKEKLKNLLLERQAGSSSLSMSGIKSSSGISFNINEQLKRTEEDLVKTRESFTNYKASAEKKIQEISERL